MLARGLQFEEINHINESDLEVRKFLTQQRGRRQGLLRWNVSGGSHHEIRLAALVIAGPIPNANALGAMDDGLLHIQKLQVLLLVAHDHIYVILAAATV